MGVAQAYLSPTDAAVLREIGVRCFVDHLLSEPEKQWSEQPVLVYIGHKSAFCWCAIAMLSAWRASPVLHVYVIASLALHR